MQRRNAISRATVIGISVLLSIGISGCPQTPGSSGTITFNLPPTPVITSNVDRGVAPLTVSFTSDRSTDDGLIVARSWDFGDDGTSEEISPSHTFDSTGEFTVRLTLTDDDGAEATRTVVISVTEGPVAVIAAEPAIAESAPAVVEFDASASYDPDGDIVSYQWDFGDGSREFLQAVTHVYATSGTYRAKLTVTDDTGVTGTAEKLIKVGIRTPTIEMRVPPPTVSNIVVTQDSPLWVQAVYEVESGVARFTQAGIDRDRDQCEAQSVMYDISTGAEIVTLIGHEDRVTGVAYSPDGVRMASSSDDGTVRVYNAATGALLSEFTGAGQITSLAFSPGGTKLVWGQSDGDVVLVNAETGDVVRTFTGHTAMVNDVAYSPEGTQILSGSNDRRALLWNTADGTVLRDFGHDLGVNAVAFSPTDPTMVATGGEEGVIKIWNTTSGTQLLGLAGHTGPVNDLVFGADGLSLLSASDDNTARAWSPFDGSLVITYAGHSSDVLAIAISADDTMVVTGGYDGTARVWNSATAETLQTVQPCVSPITSVAISTDDTHVLAGVGARNSIQLDSDPANGNDLNITIPTALTLSNVEALDRQNVDPGRYYLWAEIMTDQSDEPVRTYAEATINVVDDFTSTIDGDTPAIPLMTSPDDDDISEASVVVPWDSTRQIFDLGALNQGDRLFISLMSAPGFGDFYTPQSEFSLMIVDANQRILTWYEALYTTELEQFVLFTPETKLIVGHNSLHYYVIADGGVNVHVRVQADSGLFEPLPQRVFVDFDGAADVAAGNQPIRTIPALRASDFNQFFAVSPDWDDDETTILKTVVMAKLRDIYSAFDVEFVSSDDGVLPDLPFQTIHIGGSTPDELLGISDYVDPRNDTTTGTAIVYATEIAEQGITGSGGWTNPMVNVNDLGVAVGTVAAHQVGQLLGLRNTDDPTDIMEGSSIRQVADPTIPRILKSATVTATEQVGSLGAIGIQNAPLLLQETIGLDP